MQVSSLMCGIAALVVALVILLIYYMKLDNQYLEITGWLLGVGGSVLIGMALAGRESHHKEAAEAGNWWENKSQ